MTTTQRGLLAGTLVSFLDGWRGNDRPPRADRARRSEVPLAGAACDADCFRQVMGMFPSPVSVVTALDRDGEPRGLTCSAVCSLSMEPPALLCCVNRRNRSLDAIRDSGGFAVNLLRAGRKDLSNVFASGNSAKFHFYGITCSFMLRASSRKRLLTFRLDCEFHEPRLGRGCNVGHFGFRRILRNILQEI